MKKIQEIIEQLNDLKVATGRLGSYEVAVIDDIVNKLNEILKEFLKDNKNT